jgi:apolipoprotein N-acyltransferase
VQELLPGQASQPAGRQEADVLPGLRLGSPSFPASLIAAAASGFILTLALPPVDAGPLAFIALVPLLWAIRGARARRGAVLGLIFGLVYFGVLLSWLIPITRLGWFVLVAVQAGYMALLLAFTAAVWREESPVRSSFAIAAGWAAVEWLRGLWPVGGFTWGGLGYTQHDNPLLLPLASIAGVWGISFVVASANALVLAAGVRFRREPLFATRIIAMAAVAVFLPVLVPIPAPEGPAVDVAVVQGNVPKFVAVGSRIIEDRIVAENHARQHVRLVSDPPDLAVWPENAIDRDPTRDPELGPLVTEPIRAVGAYTLVGAVTETDDGRLFNQDLLYTPDARPVARYTKNHLVPYGEYVPFRRYLSWIKALEQVPRDMTPGERPGLFDIPKGRFAAVICFENAFPDLVRRFLARNAGFLVVSTNNATFLRSPASAQHVVMSELRAVENGRWVVHAAISGISAIVDHRGRVVGETALFKPAILRADIPQGKARTVFNVIGGWIPVMFFVGALGGFMAARRRKRLETSPSPDDPRVAVVLPTYNERDNVEEVLRRLLAVGERIDVIVVDDSSPDGTGELVRKHPATQEGRVALMERPGKQGLASAYRDGFRRALDSGYDLVVEMDSDLSHRPEDLPRLLEGARHFDLTVGSRYIKGGAIQNWSLSRRILSRGGNIYARIILGHRVKDSTSGYRAFRPEVLVHLLERGIASEGYGFQIELAYRAWQAGFSVGEVPITFEDRKAGTSKLSRGIVIEALWRVLQWGIRDRFLRRSSKNSTATRST